MLRLASAVVLAGLIISVIWWLPPWATAVLAALVSALAAAELAGFAARVGAAVPTVFVAIAAATVTLAFVTYERRIPGASDDSLGAVIVALLVVGGTITLVQGPPTPQTLTRAAVLVMAPLYVGLPLGTIVWVQSAFGPATTSWLIGTIVASDSAQYYTGRAFGRRKLAPAVSPAKTVEGAVGGIVAAGLVGLFIGPLCLPGMGPWIGVVIGVVLAMFGIAGDLFESLLKRSAGVKDSSALIPGHGGVLDRIDAQLFAAPVFYLLLRYVV